jgi:hypothetical protein
MTQRFRRARSCPRLASHPDPADFTEIGWIYRHKAVWVELAILMWIPSIPIARSITETAH